MAFLVLSKEEAGVKHNFALDRPVFTRTMSTPPELIRALIEELRSKSGVPVIKLTQSLHSVEKTLHVDPSGLFLCYSPSPKLVVQASIFIPCISEVRLGAVSTLFRQASIAPERMPYCFSVVQQNGVTWDFMFQSGTGPLWKGSLELLMRRALRVYALFPLKTTFIHLWAYCCVDIGGADDRAAAIAATGTEAQVDGGRGELSNTEPFAPSARQKGGDERNDDNNGEPTTKGGSDDDGRDEDAASTPLDVPDVVTDTELCIFLGRINAPIELQHAAFALARQRAKLLGKEALQKKIGFAAGTGTSDKSKKLSKKAAAAVRQKGLPGVAIEMTWDFPQVVQFLCEQLWQVPQLRILFDRYATCFVSPDGSSVDTEGFFSGPLVGSFRTVDDAYRGVQEGGVMLLTVAGFKKFNEDCQFEVLSYDDAVNIMLQYRLWESEDKVEDGDVVMNFTQFCAYLIDSTSNTWFKPRHTTVYQDMTQPLCQYFMNSTHNTYLTGDQFQSESSTEMYRISLLRGARCVELDCWDGDDGFPIVYHGHTRTTKITFEAVVRTIEEAAFVTSPYPVILSLEVHTCPDQQHIMALMMADIFGDKLLIMSDEEMEAVALKPHVPGSGPSFTPEGLRHKILAKGKRVQGNWSSPVLGRNVDVPSTTGTTSSTEIREEEDKENEEGASGDAPPGEEGLQIDGESVAVAGTTAGIAEPKEKTKEKKKSKKDDEDDDEDDEAGTMGPEDRDPGDTRIVLSDVVTFPAHRCVDLLTSAKKCKPNACSSFGESRVLRMIQKEQMGLVIFNMFLFSRIYPKGSRINSSIYWPQPCWNAGCQIVALNAQTMDFPLRYNEAKFEQNGRCGYILKPSFLRKPRGNTTDAELINQLQALRDPRKLAEAQRAYVLSIMVICGHILPKSGLFADGETINSSVMLFLSGMPEDQSVSAPAYATGKESEGAAVTAEAIFAQEMMSASGSNGVYFTDVVDGNGANPVWMQVFHFSIHYIELACLTMRVCHSTSGTREEVAEATIPVASLRLGYRAVPLRKTDNVPVFHASLFCHFSLCEVDP